MAINLPSKLRHGDSLKTLVDRFGDLVDYVKSITPQPSATIRISHLSGGTSFYAKPALVSKSATPTNTSSYRSFFRVINASAEGAAKIGVTNGTASMLDPVGLCGRTKVNYTLCDVAAIAEAVTAAGVYHVWIHSYIDAVAGELCKMVVGDVDDDEPPDNPFGGVDYASQLAGVVTVVEDGEGVAIANTVQHYLRGGEHFELLWGDCVGEEITVPT
jgi:hypothetical protein